MAENLTNLATNLHKFLFRGTSGTKFVQLCTCVDAASGAGAGEVSGAASGAGAAVDVASGGGKG